MEKKSQKIHLTYYKLLIAQCLWPAHYQIFIIIFLKEFIEPNVNIEIMTKNVKLLELNITTATVILNAQILKMI